MPAPLRKPAQDESVTAGERWHGDQGSPPRHRPTAGLSIRGSGAGRIAAGGLDLLREPRRRAMTACRLLRVCSTQNGAAYGCFYPQEERSERL